MHATLPRFDDERTVERDFSSLVKSGTFDSLDENTNVLSGDEADLAILHEARPRAAAALETLPTPTGMRSPASITPSPDAIPVTAPQEVVSEHTPLDASASLRPLSQAPPRDEAPSGGAILAYHVAVVNDGRRVELLWLSPTESAARDLPTAMLVPTDAAAADAIADMLRRSRR